MNDFGRRVAANWTPADGLRRLRSRTYGHRVRTSAKALNRDGRMHDFGVDTNREMVHSLGGLSESKFAVKSHGDIALRIGPDSAYASLDQLPDLLSGSLAAYRGTGYRAKFPFLDDYKEVHPKSPEARGLSRDLMVRIRAGDAGEVDTAPPDDLWAFTDHEGTRYRVRGDRETTLLPEITMADVRRHIHLAGEEALSRLTVQLVDEDLHEHRPRPLLSYLTAEARRGERHYVLAGGKWYEVGHKLLEYLDRELAAIPDAGFEPLRWRSGWDEAAYNRAWAAREGWRLLDRQDFRLPRASGSVEICDVLTGDFELVCVKRMNKSEKLSHLFAQGRVSAELYTDEPVYAAAVRSRFTELRGERTALPTPSIVYAMGTHRPGDLRRLLPFFSRRNLVTEAQAVREAGFGVALAKIPMDPPSRP